MTALPAKPQEQAAFSKAQRLQPVPGGAPEPLPFFCARAVWEGFTASGYLAKHIIEPRAVTVLFGDSGSYKSAIAIDVACCVGTGRNFHRIRTRRTGVLYVAGEGCGGVRKRVRAWLMGHRMSAADPQPLVAITEAPASLLGDPEQLRATIQAAEKELGAPIELLVIDTLAANFGPGEENSATDMALAIANARSAAPAAAFLVVHHSGHGDGARERGSSSLPFGADFRFRAIYDKDSRTVELRCVKAKDDEVLPSIFFTAKRLGVEWLDVDGEELSAIVLERTEEPEQIGAAESRGRSGASGLGANQETVIKIVRRLYRAARHKAAEEGRDPFAVRILADGLRNAVVSETRVSAKRYGEALETLISRGLVRLEGPHVLLSEE